MSKSLLVLQPGRQRGLLPPLSREPLSAEQAAQVAPLLKALADPVRLRLMSLIASPPAARPASATSTTPSTCPSPRSATI